MEKSISDLDNKLMIHHDTLKKLKRKLEIVRQIHSAPEVYARAVVEVVRRKIFTRHFVEVGDMGPLINKIMLHVGKICLCHAKFCVSDYLYSWKFISL